MFACPGMNAAAFHVTQNPAGRVPKLEPRMCGEQKSLAFRPGVGIITTRPCLEEGLSPMILHLCRSLFHGMNATETVTCPQRQDGFISLADEQSCGRTNVLFEEETPVFRIIGLRSLFSFTLFLAASLAAGLLPSTACAQFASVSGQVTDQVNAAIPGVEVEISNTDTGVGQVTKTNGDGFYSISDLKPGHYAMKIRKEGFQSVSVTGITLNIEDNLSRNFALRVGSALESVTVVADQTNLNTTDASVGTVIDRQFVEDLPLNGRSFNTLLQLTPGVVIAQITNPEAPGQFSISGQRTDSNNWTVDGVSANFGAAPSAVLGQSGTGTSQAFSALGGTSSLASVEALQEFRIQTSSFAPEFGSAPGGQVILTTRSGTNKLHGGVYDYFRNTVMDANDWFANQAALPRAPEHHNDFGGFLGGPIWRDKTFYFFSYEGARLDLPQTQVVLVPSKAARSGAPAALAPFLNAYPLPNGPVNSSDPDAAQLTGTYANQATLNATSIRIDHTLNSRISLFARYNYAPSQVTNRGAAGESLNTVEPTTVNTQTLTAGLTMQFTANMLNTLRGNYSTQYSALTDHLDTFDGAVPISPSLILGSLSSASNYAYFYPYDLGELAIGPQARNRTRLMNIVDGLSLTQGAHQLKLGVDYRALFLDAVTPSYGVGLTTPSLQCLLAGTGCWFASQGTVGVSTEQSSPVYLLGNFFSLYAQDTWKLTRKLTLTYGVRWELIPAPSPRGATTFAAWKDVATPAQIAIAPAGTPVWSTTHGNFAPRVGVAYTPGKDGRFVIRAGFGIFYDTGMGAVANLATSFPNANFGYCSDVPVAATTPAAPCALPAKLSLSSPPPYPDPTFAYAPNLKLPRSYQWNLALEKSFAGSQAVSATYVGQAGRDLLREEAFYQPNANFQGEFLLTQNDARSNYNALQLQYRRPVSKGLQGLLSYTWSHSLDNSSNDVVAGLADTVISAAKDYGSSGFDVRQSLSGALTYAIPSGKIPDPLSLFTKDWSLAAVLVARTGFPFNAIVYSTSPDPEGVATSRPDLVAGQSFWVSQSGAPGGKVMNINAFSIPSTVRQGTEGRNDIPGFGMTQLDFAVSRKFPVTKKANLNFRADAFNVFNHPNFTNPAGYIEYGSFYLQSEKMLNQGLGGLNPLFQEGGPRSLQVSLRLMF